jgi:hypothetical protein
MKDGGDEYVDDDHDDNDEDDTEDSDDDADTRAFLGDSLGKMVCKRFRFELFFMESDMEYLE